MSLNDLLAMVTDPYDRNARLWPALLAILPAIALASLVYGPNASASTNLVMVTASCGGLFLLANICREFGKRLEPKLYVEWGGKPTTQLLRHSDATIEGPTKRRYHAFLSSKISEPFPSSAQELNNPAAANDLYQSGVRWLLNHTRDKKQFGLLFKENITYGFRRNALGVKPIGLTSSLGCLLWVLVEHGVISNSDEYFFDKSALLTLPDSAILSLTASAFMLAVWTTFITKASARTAAFTYAETLLRACDTLP